MFVILLSSVALALEDPVKEDSDRFEIIISNVVNIVVLIFIVVQKPEVGPARLRLHSHLCD